MKTADMLSVLSENAHELQNGDRMCRYMRNGIMAEMMSAVQDPTSAREVFRTVFGDSFSISDYASFCRALLEDKTDPPLAESLLPDFTPLGEEYKEGRTAYLSNPYSERAFDHFSAYIPQMTANRHPSFSAVCEEVYYDRSQYCILPLSSSEDGTLLSFSRMMLKYELKIHSVCDIISPDNDTIVRFALLRRGIVPRIPDSGFAEIRFLLPEDIKPGAFFAACEKTGAEIERIRTVPTSYTNDISSFCVTFRISKKCGAPLLLFLRSVLYSYSVEGIFSAV